MKVFVLLAFVAFTGCNAEASHLQLDQLTDAFWNYVAQATQTAEDTMQMIRTSEFGQEVNTRLTESADVASKYAVTLQNQMTPLAQDVMAKITNEAEVLKERLTQDLATVQGELEPYANDMRVQVLQRVEDLKVAVAPFAESLDSESLKTTLFQKSEELKGSLEKSVQELQSQLGPYTEELRQKVDQHLQEFQASVAPLTADLQTQLTQRTKMIQQSLAPYAEDLKDKLDPYAQGLRAQLTSLFESFSKTS
ncbi:apolipoprotein A-IV-like [Engraulis encrasicolus]|uniref:apolipoprotein A-IV-like n=1 Tax=Engraulis encrasicolus TaxID=184585 RepID=UPI002FD3A569